MDPLPRRSIRLRCGRGGRAFIDRRPQASHTNFIQRRRILGSDEEDDAMDVDDAKEVDEEADRRLSERWKFDADDGPPYGPSGSEEQDRALVDDYDVKYVTSYSHSLEPVTNFVCPLTQVYEPSCHSARRGGL